MLDIPLAAPCVAGRLDPANARHVLALLDRATDGCMNGEFAAMVTAPVQKSVINEAGVPFTGHTEYLAARTGAAHPVMLLAADSLRVALATTHLPLRAVSDAITAPLLDTTLRILEGDVRRLWGISRPRIAVCGLNPHAGESGHLGTEDREVIAPAIERAAPLGMLVDGPIPADTVFVPRALSNYDVVLAMYPRSGPARAQTCRVRTCRERDAGSAHRPHLGGSRYRARPRRHRPRRRRQPHRRHPARARVRGPPGRKWGHS